MEPVVVGTYARKQLTPLEMTNIERAIKRVPRILLGVTAIKLQIENARLVRLVRAYRQQRNLTPLKDDYDFINCWDAIDAALEMHQSETALRLVMRENMRLTAEVIEHQKSLGLPVMKTYRVRA